MIAPVSDYCLLCTFTDEAYCMGKLSKGLTRSRCTPKHVLATSSSHSSFLIIGIRKIIVPKKGSV